MDKSCEKVTVIAITNVKNKEGVPKGINFWAPSLFL
jgi:hypothetical protein